MKTNQIIAFLQHLLMEGARKAKDREIGIVNVHLESIENDKKNTILLRLITDGIPIESDAISKEDDNFYIKALSNLIIKLITIAVYEKHKLPF